MKQSNISNIALFDAFRVVRKNMRFAGKRNDLALLASLIAEYREEVNASSCASLDVLFDTIADSAPMSIKDSGFDIMAWRGAIVPTEHRYAPKDVLDSFGDVNVYPLDIGGGLYFLTRGEEAEQALRLYTSVCTKWCCPEEPALELFGLKLWC